MLSIIGAAGSTAENGYGSFENQSQAKNETKASLNPKSRNIEFPSFRILGNFRFTGAARVWAFLTIGLTGQKSFRRQNLVKTYYAC